MPISTNIGKYMCCVSSRCQDGTPIPGMNQNTHGTCVGITCPNCSNMLPPIYPVTATKCDECSFYVIMTNECIQWIKDITLVKGYNSIPFTFSPKHHPNYGTTMSDDERIDVETGKKRLYESKAVSPGNFRPKRDWYYMTVNGSVVMYIGNDVCDTTRMHSAKFIIKKLARVHDMLDVYGENDTPKEGDLIRYDSVYTYIGPLAELFPEMQIRMELGPHYDR